MIVVADPFDDVLAVRAVPVVDAVAFELAPHGRAADRGHQVNAVMVRLFKVLRLVVAPVALAMPEGYKPTLYQVIVRS